MNHAHLHRTATRPLAITALSAAFALACCPLPAAAQTAKTDAPPQTHYVPSPAFDTSSIDPKADPCNDFYKFACGNFAANHPIPADQSGVDQFYVLYNVNTQELNGILQKYAAADPSRTANEQKIGDYYRSEEHTSELQSP